MATPFYIGFLALVFSVIKVDSIHMNMKGPVLTRYDPCGIGALYFNKMTDKLWQGVVNLGLYQTVENSVIELSFKQQMFIYGTSMNSTMSTTNNWHDFVIKPKGELPKWYYFYLMVNEVHPENVPVVTRFRFNNITLCDESIKRSQTIASLNITTTNDNKYYHVCGRRALDHAELTSLRTESQPGDWPWHVAIIIKDPDTNALRYQCGGNIISQHAVLTAAHCLVVENIRIPAENIIIEAGVTNLRDLNTTARQAFVPTGAVVHPAYNSADATSDLAIITVSKFKFTEFVQPICLWGPVYDKTALYGKESVVVGFGTTEQNKLSDKLRATNIMVQHDATCIAYAPKLYQPLLNEFTFCAGYGPTSGINPRNGDSGGGLVVPTMQSDHKISWFLRGVLSKCGVIPPSIECDPKFYVVYTDVGPHYSWIFHNAGLTYRSNIVN